MNDIQKMAAQAAMKTMLSKNYFSISTIDDILRMTGGKPNTEDYNILRALHCVNYGDMPPELLRGLPVLIQRVVMSESISLEFKESTNKLMVVK
jgi:hypothetical protein